jgi:hypothetical protein
MIEATTNAVHSQPVAQSKGAPAQKPAKPAPTPASTDSVQLSSAAQTRLAAIQEVRETSAQTSQEAAKGDHQAQRLLARESAKSGVK